MLWENEFGWSPVVSAQNYALTGALIIEQAVRLAGRPITLSAPSENHAWVYRSVGQKLKDWSALLGRKFTLVFQYPLDTRQFLVMFDNSQDAAVMIVPVRGKPQHDPDDWFRISSLKFIEVV